MNGPLLAARYGCGVLRRLVCLSFALCIAFGSASAAFASPGNDAAPRRVVSMNLCTDQLAMMIAAPGQLYSVSSLATDPAMSLMAKEASAFRANHGLAEEIFQMQPDLVLVGVMTTRSTVAMLRRLGFRVIEFPFENSFDDMRANIRRMGEALHRQERAAELIERFDADLARLQQHQGPRHVAVLYHASGYTSGAGTLANEILSAAGYDNLAAKLGLFGMTKLPLEQLVLGTPDLVVTDPSWEGSPALAQEIFSHPALRALLSGSARSTAASNRWICATPHLIDLIGELSAVHAVIGPLQDQSQSQTKAGQ